MTQAPPQATWPLGQTQVPATQLAPVAQALPQAPQLFRLEPRSRHMPEHSESGLGQTQSPA
jgi:hypothetical protein